MSETAVVQCPSCAAKFRVTPDKLGRTFTCPKCSQPFTAAAAVAPAAVPPVVVPPPLPVSVPPPLPAAYPSPAMEYALPDQSQKTSGVAVASLVCGILFCFPLCGLAALILGIVGINQTKPGMAKGRGMAIAGTILGSLGLVFIPVLLMISILLPALNKARETANRAKCASNMHQIGLAILLYQQDNNQAYPPDLTTLWQHEQLTGSVFVCPSSNDTPAAGPAQLTSGGHLSYTYAPPAPGETPDATTPVLYETAAPHGRDGSNILFGDGAVNFYNAASAKRLIDQVSNR